MARKIKFALEMADGAKVRGSLEELREHFDLESAVRYFLSGKLVEWLDDRYYEKEAEALEAIDKNAPDLNKRLCEALGVEYEAEEDLDVAALERLNEKKSVLRQRTDNEEIVKNADKTALTQEDLADLLDMGEDVIYLCGEEFTVPARVKNKKYIGILGTPKVTINAKSQEELDAKGIVFENVVLPWRKESKNLDEKIAETPVNESNLYTWKVSKEKMDHLFQSIFGREIECEIADYHQDRIILFNIKTGHIFLNDDNNKFTAIGYSVKDPKTVKKFTTEQKDLALSVICKNKYSEDEIIHLRTYDDFSYGWALTRDSFCANYEDEFVMIPYDELNFIKEKMTTYIANEKGNKWKFSTKQKLYFEPLRTHVSPNGFNEETALYRYLTTISNMFK